MSFVSKLEIRKIVSPKKIRETNSLFIEKLISRNLTKLLQEFEIPHCSQHGYLVSQIVSKKDVSTSISIVHDLIERYHDDGDESDKHV